MIRARFERDVEIGAKKCRANFSDELFTGIGVVGKSLAKIAVAPLGRRGPVRIMPISA
jgi:hypothetical protein